MKLLHKFLFVLLIVMLLVPGGLLFAQEVTPEVGVELSEQADVTYSAATNLVDDFVGSMPLLALIVSLGVLSYTIFIGRVGATGLPDELVAIRQTKIFSDAERSYERIQTPTSNMSIDVGISFLRATIMLPFLPRPMEDGLVGVVKLLEDLKDGPDGDEKA